ncbi:MAG: DUF2505 family protein [Bradymonadia bacterium]
MSISFNIGGFYPINKDRFWNEVFFTEQYTKDLFLVGLNFHDVRVQSFDEMSDGRITRVLQVTPKLTLPAPVKRLVNDGLIYQEVGKFNPDVGAFESTLSVPSSPKLLTIKSRMHFTDGQNNGCNRHVSFTLTSSVFGVAKIVEKTAKHILTQQYSTAEKYTQKWIRDAGLAD